MSAKWMSKVHALAPMTMQEEEVKERLDALHVQYSVHTTFQVGRRLMVPDFFLPRLNLVIECRRSRSRRGTALGWAERNGVYVNLKFRRLKAAHPEFRCLGLVESPQVDRESLREAVGEVMGMPISWRTRWRSSSSSSGGFRVSSDGASDRSGSSPDVAVKSNTEIA